jgi:hypothetical protein
MIWNWRGRVVYMMADYVTVKMLHYPDITSKSTFIRIAPSLAEDSEYMIRAKTTGSPEC